MDNILSLLNDILLILQNLLSFVVDAFGSIPDVIETLENASSSAAESLAAMPTELVAPCMSLLYFMIALAGLRWVT